MTVHTLAYLSEATRDLLPEELDAILMDARLFNASVAVTGVLFYSQNRFFQYVEGDAASVKRVFDRLKGATSHHRIQMLREERAPYRAFESWHMGFATAPETAMQKLAQTDWSEAMPITRSSAERSEGLELALFYWNKWLAERPYAVP